MLPSDVYIGLGLDQIGPRGKPRQLYRHSPDAGLQMPVFCASGAHVPKRTLRSGTRKPTFSAPPELNGDTT